MNVLLFGAPGIGKSTLVEAASQYVGDDHAVDLERPESRQLLALMGWDWMFCSGRLGSSNIIGGADLDPRAYYPQTVKVVLTLDEEEYRMRRSARDRKMPHKAQQPSQLIAQWAGIKDAEYLQADAHALERILDMRRRQV